MLIDSVVFDDVVFEKSGVWTQICVSCAKQLVDSGFLEEIPIIGLICGVSGCQNESDYYWSVKNNEK